MHGHNGLLQLRIYSAVRLKVYCRYSARALKLADLSNAAVLNVKCHVVFISVRFHIAHVLELQVSNFFLVLFVKVYFYNDVGP